MYGAKIRAIRIARDYTQQYVADKIGIEQNEYSRIETDQKNRLSDDLLNNIAVVLGVSVEDIKSPSPIIMSFHNSPNSGQYNQPHYAYDQQMLNALTSQLAEKDKQLAEKDAHITRLLSLIK